MLQSKTLVPSKTVYIVTCVQHLHSAYGTGELEGLYTVGTFAGWLIDGLFRSIDEKIHMVSEKLPFFDVDFFPSPPFTVEAHPTSTHLYTLVSSTCLNWTFFSVPSLDDGATHLDVDIF